MAKLQQGVAAGAEGTPNPGQEGVQPDAQGFESAEDQQVIGQDFFGYQSEDTATGEGSDSGDGAETDPAALGSQGSPEADPDKQRFEYWQSKHDQMAQRMAEMEAYVPVIEFINQNPQLLEAIENTVGGATRPQSVQPQPQVLQRPVPPGPRPAGYSDADAYTNPDSESFKWRIAKEQFTDQLLDYQSRLLESQVIEQKQRKVIEYQSAQQAAAMNRLRAELKTKFHLDGSDMEDFIHTMSDPASVSLENLYALWQLRKGKVVPQANAQRLAAQIQQQRQNVGAPPPVGVQPGSSNRQQPAPANDNAAIAQSFAQFAKRARIRL